MKKIFSILIILVIIFVGIVIYKNNTIHNNQNITIQEINDIETYITKIYMWKEITKEALPVFDDINQADDLWTWEVVKKNLEDYELSYEQIQEKAKELFGEKFTKPFPKEGSEYLIYNEENDQYYATGMGLDFEEDEFLLNEIKPITDGYEVEIIEYLEDYSESLEGEEGNIIIRNLKEEEIGKISSLEEEKSKDFVKNNIEKFTKKKVILKRQDEKIYVERVE